MARKAETPKHMPTHISIETRRERWNEELVKVLALRKIRSMR